MTALFQFLWCVPKKCYWCELWHCLVLLNYVGLFICASAKHCLLFLHCSKSSFPTCSDAVILLESPQNRFLHANAHDALQVVISFCWKKLISVTISFNFCCKSDELLQPVWYYCLISKFLVNDVPWGTELLKINRCSRILLSVSVESCRNFFQVLDRVHGICSHLEA